MTPISSVTWSMGALVALMHPARAVHWDGAKDEEVILQIIGYGPTDTIPIKPADGLFTATH
jgi:hypothetical protein